MNKAIQLKLDAYLNHELDPAFARRARLLVEGLNIKGKEHILEVGCGRGYYEGLLTYLYPSVRITAIDRSDTYLDKARSTVSSSKVTFKNVDALNLPWKSNTFDRVFATEVLEHLPDDRKGLSEMYRVLKPGGTGVVTVPNKNYPFLWDPLNWMLEHVFHTHVSKDIWWLAGIWADHERLYTKKDLSEKIIAAGFSIEEMMVATHYSIPFSHFLLYGIGKNIVEKGLLPEFYRFNPEKKPSLFFQCIHRFVYMNDYKNKNDEKNLPSVNIIAILRK